MKDKEERNWQVADTKVFWGEIAPTDHILQIYENEESFLCTLEGFVLSGLEAGECVVLIATPAHINSLRDRLSQKELAIVDLMADDQLIFLDAEETLSKFMVNGWPDAMLFDQTISAIVKRATNRNRSLRAFGEMVALLWAKGEKSATVHLEILWNRICEMQHFCLFCAYPSNGFTQEANLSADTICCAHAKMISGDQKSSTNIFYKSVSQQQSGVVT